MTTTKLSDEWLSRDKKGQYIKKPTNSQALQHWIEQRVKIDLKGCWKWVLSLHRDGYAKINKFGFWQGHRLSYYAFHKVEYKKNLLVLHRCHNRDCVNPDHLYQGTHFDNAKDTAESGRAKGIFLNGIYHKNVKLTEYVVLAIRDLFSKKYKVREIAKIYNLPRTTVSAVCHRHSWRHLP